MAPTLVVLLLTLLLCSVLGALVLRPCKDE